jgi:hypothetical protein
VYVLTINSEPQELVSIHVGKDESKKIFQVYAILLSTHSEYFATGLRTNCSEGQGKVFNLPDEDPAVFGYVIEWILTGKIVENLRDPKMERCSGDVGNEPALDHLHALWILADSLLMPALQNYVIERISTRQEASNTLSNYEFPMIFEKCPLGSPLRRYVVDRCVWNHLEDDVFGPVNSTYYTVEMLSEIIRRYQYRIFVDSASPLTDISNYYVTVSDGFQTLSSVSADGSGFSGTTL